MFREEFAAPGASVPSGAWISPAGDVGLQGVVGPPGPGFGPATSSTSNTVGTGSKTFVVQPGLAYTIGARVRIASQGAPTNWMEGVITAYNSSTGALTVNVDTTNATPITGGVGEAPADSHYYARYNASWADIAAIAPALVLPHQLAGLTLSNDGTTPATVLDIATGSACSDDVTTMMWLTAAGFTKNCNAAWAVGSGNGAKDTAGALVASIFYHVFLIKRTDTGVTDVLISTSLTPTMPTNYTKKRRIGSIYTDTSAHITAFSQFGDEFLWRTTFASANGATPPTNAATLLGTSVPPGVKVRVRLRGYWINPTASYQLFLISPDETGAQGSISIISNTGNYNGIDTIIRTNTASQITWWTNSPSGAQVWLWCQGYFDPRDV